MNKILVVEDDIILGQLLVNKCKTMGYIPTYAANGVEGLEIYKKDQNVILVIDLQMPLMSGEELISIIKEMDEDALIIVATAMAGASDIIKIMKLGVYDYLIKPIDSDEFSLKLKRISEAYDFRKLKRNLEKEKLARIESQLEWLQYKEKNRNVEEFSNKSDIHSSLFFNLRQNFSQGAGIGSISAMIGLMSIAPQNEEGDYVVAKDVVEFMLENNSTIQKALGKFEEIESLIFRDIALEKSNCQELYQLVHEEKRNLNKYLNIKSNEIIISDSKLIFKSKELMINKDLFSKIVNELIMNALKFSKEHSKVIVLLDIVDNNFVTTIINEAEADQKGRVGIPEEFQNLIFEPFFKISRFENMKYETMNYGLGLTFVEKAVKRLNGKIKVHNIKVHAISQSQPLDNVEISISIPLIQTINT